MFFGQIFSLLISFFIGAWLARYLGPNNYGILSYAVAFVGLFGFIASFGIDSILNRELVKTPEKKNELLGTAFYLKTIGSIIAILLVIVSTFVFKFDSLTRFLAIAFSFTFLLQAINVISIYFQSQVQAKNNVKVIFISSLISSILKVGVIFLDKGIIWIMAVYILDFVWQLIIYISVYRKNGFRIINWEYNKDLAKKILKNSWPLMLALATGYIYLKIDQVMIGSMLGKYEVGLYAVAVKLTEVWYFIPSIICASLFPAIINAKKSDIRVYNNRLKNLYILMFVFSIIIAVIMTLLAKPIVYILFGSGYLESVGILKVYIWSSIGLFLGTAINQYLIAENLVKTIFILNFLTMIVNIGLNFVFINKFGLLGAAWSTLISYFIIPIIVLSGKKFFIKNIH